MEGIYIDTKYAKHRNHTAIMLYFKHH